MLIFILNSVEKFFSSLHGQQRTAFGTPRSQYSPSTWSVTESQMTKLLSEIFYAEKFGDETRNEISKVVS